MLYTSPWWRFELTTSVLIGTDSIGSCKSIYHAITATKTPCKYILLCSIYLLIYQDISEYNEFAGSSHHCVLQNKNKGPSWSWSYMVVGFTNTYAINQCTSLLALWVQPQVMASFFRYNIMWWSLSVTCNRSVAFSEYSGSSTHKTDRHDRT
jgi:hypothetical protein